MLRSGVVIDANLSRRLDILRALDVGMDQRGIAAPILVRRIGQEDLGLPPVRAEPVEEPAPVPRYIARAKVSVGISNEILFF